MDKRGTAADMLQSLIVPATQIRNLLLENTRDFLDRKTLAQVLGPAPVEHGLDRFRPRFWNRGPHAPMDYELHEIITSDKGERLLQSVNFPEHYCKRINIARCIVWFLQCNLYVAQDGISFRSTYKINVCMVKHSPGAMYLNEPVIPVRLYVPSLFATSEHSSVANEKSNNLMSPRLKKKKRPLSESVR